MKLRGAVMLAMVLCLPAAGWAAFTLSHQLIADGNTPPELRQFIPADPPRPAPAITVSDGAGNTLTLADFRGRFVLVNLHPFQRSIHVQIMRGHSSASDKCHSNFAHND